MGGTGPGQPDRRAHRLQRRLRPAVRRCSSGLSRQWRSRRSGRTRGEVLQSPDELVTFATTSVAPGDVDGWGGYVAGVAWALRMSGHPVPDLDLLIDSVVPPGAGLSSSAALECAVASAWTELVGADVGSDGTSADLPAGGERLRRRADGCHGPDGVDARPGRPRGFPRHPLVGDRACSARVGGARVVLLVVDTKAPHRHADGEYADRRRACEEAARVLGVPALRDASRSDLDPLPADLLPRARHVVTENARVLDVVGAAAFRCRSAQDRAAAHRVSRVAVRRLRGHRAGGRRRRRCAARCQCVRSSDHRRRLRRLRHRLDRVERRRHRCRGRRGGVSEERLRCPRGLHGRPLPRYPPPAA